MKPRKKPTDSGAEVSVAARLLIHRLNSHFAAEASIVYDLVTTELSAKDLDAIYEAIEAHPYSRASASALGPSNVEGERRLARGVNSLRAFLQMSGPTPPRRTH